MNGFHIVVPPNGFRRAGAQEFEYESNAGGNKVEVSIELDRSGVYHQQRHRHRHGAVHLEAPVVVTLTIGDDTGTGPARSTR